MFGKYPEKVPHKHCRLRIEGSKHTPHKLAAAPPMPKSRLQGYRIAEKPIRDGPVSSPSAVQGTLTLRALGQRGGAGGSKERWGAFGQSLCLASPTLHPGWEARTGDFHPSSLELRLMRSPSGAGGNISPLQPKTTSHIGGSFKAQTLGRPFFPGPCFSPRRPAS